ncbi:uncharacterized protein LOC105430504 [Pogonomyrmex barbatus]|uniref:Uncharacterized protein LOC105430504 n=1 Tax=Pogonomyrmex barbatus TaxID=144034 RepID=A0A6I9WHQ6_9HYME|nr:uncharacterized protein LOC105430504 [Pogonomyrmex barbatus]XP_011642401.1 uncharacterized protein LOC105430504 [Pogonomyrmex barbatus]XP_011642402.1 uncharacterized protein LOC105430504 [Pogonomyrmex barbatus]
MKTQSSLDTLPVKNLDTLLMQTYGPNFKIHDVEWRHLTDPGENFGSVILAIKVNAEQNDKKRTLSIVVKLPPKSEYLLDLFDSPLTFKKELKFYSVVAPEFLKLQNESGIPREALSVITPQFFGGRLGLRDPQCFDEQAAIVLENLKDHNYITQDRILGLDKVHMDFAISHLAKLHAIAIGLKLKKPEFFEKMVLPILNFSINQAAQQGVLDMVGKAHNDYKNIKEAETYLDRIQKTIEYGFANEHAPSKEPWATLVHHDFWVNNMMFKYDESGKPIDMKMVDFQLTLYTYGVRDLIFFLISSSRKEVLDNHLDEMIDFYYNSFIESLKSLGVDITAFPKSQFMEQLNQVAPIMFNQCIMMVQVIQAARGSVTETTETANKGVFAGGINDVNYKQKMLHILSIFEQKGWFVN